jgi:uncharacterized coiled-coil DUF342 family protein
MSKDLEGFMLTTEVNLEKVYAEMKRVRLELKSIEHTLNDLADAMLPTEKMSTEEKKELREIDEEMARGECVSLEEVKKSKSLREYSRSWHLINLL